MKKSFLFSTTALWAGPTAHWVGRLLPVPFKASSKPTHANRISAVMKRIMFVIAAISMANAVSAQDWAKARLEKSPRHLEWVKVKQGKREVNCFVAYPEVKDKATAVVVIHEIFRLTD